MDDDSTTEVGQRHIKKAKRLGGRNQGLLVQRSAPSAPFMNTFPGSAQPFEHHQQQQQPNFGNIQHQMPASHFTSKCPSQQSTQSILPGLFSATQHTGQSFTPLVTGIGIGSNSMSQPIVSNITSLSSPNLLESQVTSATSTISIGPASPMEGIYTGLPKWSSPATSTITAISTPTKSSALENQPQMNIISQPSTSLFGGGTITPLQLIGQQGTVSSIAPFGSNFVKDRNDKVDEYKPEAMRGMSFGSDTGKESDPDEDMPLAEAGKPSKSSESSGSSASSNDIKRTLGPQTAAHLSEPLAVILGPTMQDSRKRKVADTCTQSITRKGYDNGTSKNFSTQISSDWMKSLTMSFKKYPTIVPITKTSTPDSLIRQSMNGSSIKKLPTSLWTSSKENASANDSTAKLHATEASTPLNQHYKSNKVQPAEQTTSRTASTAATSSANKDIDSTKIDLPNSTASDALTVDTQHQNYVTPQITKDTDHVAALSLNTLSKNILKPSLISPPPTLSITKIEHIQQQTRYSQLPDDAQSALLDAERIIDNQQAFCYNILGANGAFGDSDMLHIKDRAYELRNDTGILMEKLDQQMRKTKNLGVATQQQMDTAMIGKPLKNNDSIQQLFKAGNHYYYLAQLSGKLQQQLGEFDATIKKIEKRLLLQQEELTPGIAGQKLSGLVASQNEILLSLAGQAGILHEMVQGLH